MNRTLWILTITIALCMTLPKQVRSPGEMDKTTGGSSSGSSVEKRTCEGPGEMDKTTDGSSSGSSVEKRTCEGWILAYGFSEINYHNKNKIIVDRRDPCLDPTINIFALAYIKTLIASPEDINIDPYTLCWRYNISDESAPREVNITPQGPKLSCTKWIELSGFASAENEYREFLRVGFSATNKNLARRQFETYIPPVHEFLSKCAALYVIYLMTNDIPISIKDFCGPKHLNIPDGVPVAFDDCRDPNIANEGDKIDN